MAGRKITYTEPEDFIPKEIRKELKLGEYAEDEKKPAKKKSEKPKKK